MKILVGLLKLFLTIVYSILKLLKTQNKIVFISRQSNKPTQDIELLSNELKKELPNYKIIILSRKLEHGLSNKIKYFFHIFTQMYHLATSKIVLLDSYCIIVSLLHHKKNLRVIQMWHGIGTLKKSGYSILDTYEGRSKKIATLMKMHKNYDYIFCSAEICRKDSVELFNTTLDKVLVYPLPRVNLLIDKKYQKDTQNKVYQKYPELKNKKNIVYVPTYRVDNDKLTKAIEDLIECIDYTKYNLIIKLHPLTTYVNNETKALFDKLFTTTEMLFIADYVIADYSTVLFEAAVLNKPLFFYAYDKNNYVKQRNFYIDYEKEMPGLISQDPKEIFAFIKKDKYDLEKIKSFSNKYVEIKGNPTKNICIFIKRILEEEEVK